MAVTSEFMGASVTAALVYYHTQAGPGGVGLRSQLLQMLRKEDHEFKTSTGYTASSRPA